MLCIHAVFFVAAFLKELGRNLRELRVAEHILFLLVILCRQLAAQLFELGLEQVGGTAVDGGFVLDDEFAELRVDGSGGTAIFARAPGP
jgi:hypothetical protein